MIAWNESSPAMPCWMLLITASSAARCSVSLSSRCVSSNRRAFSSATPMLAATVLTQSDLGFAEGILALVALERDHTEHAVAAKDGNDSYSESVPASVPGWTSNPAALISAGFRQIHGRRARLQLLTGAVRLGRSRFARRKAHAVFVLVQVWIKFGFGSCQRMPMSSRFEHLAQLVADQVDDRLEVELGRHPFLDAVDQRQLGRALLGLLQQSLRLVEEARVLQRHAHAGRDRGQQPHLGLAERVLALVVLQTMIRPSTRSLPMIGT